MFNLKLICTCEFFKKLKLHSPKQLVQFRFLKNSLVQINSKLNLKPYDYLQEIENMYSVSIKLYKHKWKFGRTRNAVATRAAGECFHSFVEFSQTFMSVCITR